MMGRIASTMSDVTIITSDNPRHEDPQAIIREIRAGIVAGSLVHTEVDRREGYRDGFGECALRRYRVDCWEGS